ncbi:MAG: hypothetical protein H6568_14460 [Lewinellaceae bacterium]|nr:hypothetical protein [Saprospiraceae bacterium]MCB9313958.1 hypothetical protein [Lewinellaceae bacterium]
MASLIHQWREFWGYRMQDREAARTAVAQRTGGPFSFRSALILVPADQPRAMAAAEMIGQEWSHRGVQVNRLGYYPDKVDHPEAPCSYFNRKALDRKGAPHGDVVDSIRRSSVDVVLLVSAERILPLDWVALQTSARLKIAHSAAPDWYDLRLDGHEDNLNEMVRRADQLIETMKTKTNVIA